jgi:hypothetical protein
VARAALACARACGTKKHARTQPPPSSCALLRGAHAHAAAGGSAMTPAALRAPRRGAPPARARAPSRRRASAAAADATPPHAALAPPRRALLLPPPQRTTASPSSAPRAARASRRRLSASASSDSAPSTPPPATPTSAPAPASASSRPLGDGNSTWADTEHWAAPGQDVLYQLGAQSSSMRIDMGARAGMIDDLFVGKFMGKQADIASGELRPNERRTLEHIRGDYYVPPAFMDAVSLHLVKNILAEAGQLPGVPLILGIWGAKGCGKSFQTELVCKAMGVQPVIMSAGELEDEYAGMPGRRLRERYRTASQIIRNSGVMSCLIINDLDAGCGRFKNTQVTVNNQIVMGTLMNLCDHPERASVGEAWREDKTLRRVPIIITGNDLSTLYAPLLRDGRMSKFFWAPQRRDMEEMLYTLYRDDAVSREDVAALLDAFPNQSELREH